VPNIKIPVHVHFTADQLEQLVLIANSRRLSRAEVIRDAVDSYILEDTARRTRRVLTKRGAR